jgi:hypothetical protein
MSKSKIIILFTVLFIVVAAGIGAVIYFTSFTPEAKASSVAKKFMNEVLANNQDVAKHSTSISENELSDFFKSSSLRDYKASAQAQDGPTFYFLYQFTDEQHPKKARLAVADQKITSVKVGSNLGTLPKDDKPEDTAKTDDFTGACLTSEDLAFIDSENLYAHNFRAMTMIFSKNDLGYAGQKNGEKILTRLADFYKKSGDKDFKIELRGYAIDDPAKYVEQTDLAQNRAGKIREALASKGVARDRIYVGNPSVYSAGQANDPRAEYIDINIVNMCR